MFRRGVHLLTHAPSSHTGGLFTTTSVALAPKKAKKIVPVGVGAPAATTTTRAKTPVGNTESLLNQKGKGVSPSASIVAQILKKPVPKGATLIHKGAPRVAAKPSSVAASVPTPTTPVRHVAKPIAVPKPVAVAQQPAVPSATPPVMPKPVPIAQSTPVPAASPAVVAGDHKPLALHIFKQMQQLMTNLGETFKVKAYAQTVAILSKYPGPITAGTPIPGLGAKSAIKLQEICTTGRLIELEELIKSGATEKKSTVTPYTPTKSVKATTFGMSTAAVGDPTATTPAATAAAISPPHTVRGKSENFVIPIGLKSGAVATDEYCSKEKALGIFQEMYEAMKATQDPFKSKAYAQAVDALKKFPGSIYSGTYVPGLGGKSVVKLKEICTTGRLAELDAMKANNPGFSAIAQLCKVNGVGPATARKWYEQRQIDGIDKLREMADTLGLTDAQRLGVKHYEDCLSRIPYAECRVHNALLQRAAAGAFRGEVPEATHNPLAPVGEDVLAEDDPQCSVKIVVCGSHRRGRAHSGDVDALITYSDSYMEHYGQAAGEQADKDASGGRITRLADTLRAEGYLVDSISSGSTKMMAYVRLPGSPPEHRVAEDGKSNKKYPYPVRRLDIRWVPRKSFPSALLYFTGSADFNGRMRSFALSQGLTLNEYGLFRLPVDAKTGMPDLNKEVVRQASRDPANAIEGLNSEEDIFKAINFEYVNPADREK